jgi:hypothetical protein
MWPHQERSSHVLSGARFVYVSTRYYTPATLIPWLNKLGIDVLNFTIKTTDDATIAQVCLLALMVRWFMCNNTWEGVVMP